jgi:hypothetical protein
MRTLFGLIVVALLFVFPAVTFANAVYKADLIADGGSALTEIDVGDVLVWLDGNLLHVKYEVDDPWGLTETHVCVKEALADIPQKNDNPMPGRFRKEQTGEGREYDPPVSEDTYVIDVAGLNLSKLYIAAHAVVLFESGNSIYVADSILIAGATAVARLYNPGAGLDSYFDVFVSESSSQYLKDGTYPGFCVDLDEEMVPPEETPQAPYSYGPFGPFIVMVYSSYDPNLPECVIEYPENLDLVNWILTRDYVGDPGPCGLYTYGDVQVAIWMLLDDTPIPPEAFNPALGSTCDPNVQQILQDAQAYGEGFVPGGSDKYGLIAVPVDPDMVPLDPCSPVAQIFLIVVQASGDETAWGAIPEGHDDYPLDPGESNNDPDDSYAYDFPGKNWAHYIVYPPYEPQPAPPRMSLDSSVTTTWGSIKNR